VEVWWSRIVLAGSEATHSSSAGDRARPPSRAALLDVAGTLLALTDGMLAGGIHRDLLDARARVAEDRFDLAVLGEFKRGKSTLINGLLDRDLGRRGVIRDAEQRLIDMTDLHAGRLRSELADRVSNAAREYRRALAAVVSDSVDAIRGAAGRATEDRRHGQHRADARLRELSQIEHQCEQVALRLDRWLRDRQPRHEMELP
jgi:hypothetical protein